MMNLLYAVRQTWFPSIFLSRDLDRIARVSRILRNDVPADVSKDFLLQHIAEADIAVTSWDTAPFDADVMAQAKRLKLVAHAAGSLKPIVSEALWDHKVRTVSLSAAISYGVAEYCLGCMLTASKRIFWATEGTRQGQWKEGMSVFNGPFELYNQKIGIIGAGHVGRHLIRLLKSFTCDIMIYDPYLSAESAAEMGVTQLKSLDAMFAQCKVVTLCAAGNEQTRHMIAQRHFALLPKGALFINVSRGGIFDEDELAAELAKGQFIACIDVTNVEPTPVDHPFRKLPNLLFTPHLAGVAAENRLRIGTMAADEIEAFVQGKPLRYEVTKEMLARIA